MAARARSRSYVVAGSIATWKGTGSILPSQSSYTISEVCNDTVGNRHLDNPFYLRRQKNVRFIATGKTSETSGNSYWNYGGSYTATGPIPGHVPGIVTAGQPSDTTSIEMAKSRQNINRPITDLPAFIVEIKDIPRLIKRGGDLILYGVQLTRLQRKVLYELPYQVAASHLANEFGFKPLLRDFHNMMNFVGTVNKKLNHLNRLYSRGGEEVGFNSTVWSNFGSVLDGDHYVTGLYAETNRFRVARETTAKKWVSLKWKPLVQPPQTDAEKQALAVRLAYGLDVSFATLWEAMPWSWLVDWFTNAGSYLVASRNTVPVSAGGSCVMLRIHTRYTVVHRISGTGASVRTAPDGHLELNRWPGGGSSGSNVKATLPFLNGSQLSILGALAVSFFGRR